MSLARHSPREIGERNSALLNALADAYAACLHLAALGMEIDQIRLAANGGLPHIEILNPGQRRRHLHGEATGYRPAATRYRGEQSGCAIEWEEPR